MVVLANLETPRNDGKKGPAVAPAGLRAMRLLHPGENTAPQGLTNRVRAYVAYSKIANFHTCVLHIFIFCTCTIITYHPS